MRKHNQSVSPVRSEAHWAVFESLIENDREKRFEKFTRRNPSGAWLIASDYVIGDKSRPHDCMCFTIYPIDEVGLSDKIEKIKVTIKRDLKKARDIEESAISTLRDEKHFTLCFIITKQRNANISSEGGKAAIDGNINIMSAWKDACLQKDCIDRMKKFRQSAEARNFKVHLFADIFLLTNIVIVISYLLTKYTSPASIAWFSDRDNMVNAYDEIANDLFVIGYSAICQQRGTDFRSIRILMGNPEPDRNEPKKSWYDPLIIIPDYFASSLAAFNYKNMTIVSGQKKALNIVTNVITDNPNIIVFSLERSEDQLVPVHIELSRRPTR